MSDKIITVCVIVMLIIIMTMILFLLQFNIPQYQYIQNKPVNSQIESYNVELQNDGAVKLYDYKKAFDPLEDPVRRVPRHELPPLYFKRLIDLPTRGYPDSFVQLGILVREGKHHNTSENKILRLFGRQEYPGSTNYEYYTAINSGNDNIKIPLDDRKRRQELYDGDIVYIKILDGHFKVNLHKYDMPRYYPDLIY